MSNHQNSKAKLNMRSNRRRSVLASQASLFVKTGKLVSTKPRIKAVQSLVEKLVTKAKKSESEMLAIRSIAKVLFHENYYNDDSAIKIIVKELSERYKDRPGGYTRRISLGKRVSDTAPIYQLLWV